MSKTTSVTLRMDAELKRKAEELFDELGLNMTTAVTVFLKTAVRQGRIPFELTHGQQGAVMTASAAPVAAAAVPPTTVSQGVTAPKPPPDDSSLEPVDEMVWEINV